MTTLRDVAQHAGVSAMTVSNVINGRQSKVSAATAERVRRSIAQLGYVPNAQARALAGASSRIIALVYGVAAGVAPLSVSHESVFTGACEQACHEEGRALMLCAAGPDDAEAVTQRLQSWHVDGIIALATVPSAVYEALVDLGIPLVTIDHRGRATDRAPHVGRVRLDDLAGGRLAGEHLRAAGHERVLFVGADPACESPIDADRLEGLRQGMGAEADVALASAPVDYAAGLALGEQWAPRLRAEHRTAVFAVADVLAMGIVAGLRRSGLEVPTEMSVVGFDGFAVSTYTDPPLTTVVQPVEAKAAQAVQLLTQMGEEGQDVLLPVAWREGGTVAPAR